VNIKDTFAHISIKHHYREHNQIADSLSKEGLSLDEGTLWLKDVSTTDTNEWEILNIY